MKKKILIFLIITISLILSSCSEEGKQYENQESIDSTEEIKKEEVLSENIEKLFLEKSHELMVKQANGEYYPATEEFTDRILEKLEEYNLDEADRSQERDYNVILNFKGFKEIYLNTEKGYYSFDDSEEVYNIVYWDDTFWERYILKEINGEITYYGFEKDVLIRNYTNLYEDGKDSEILLYYDGDIRLSFKNQAITVLPNVPEDSIESLVASNQLTNQLFVKEDTEEDRYVFLVGSKYTFTNRYGSTAWLSSYEYSDNKLKEIFDMKDVYLDKIIVKAYDKNTITLEIENKDLEFSIELNKEETDRVNEYISFLDEAGEKLIGKDDYVFFSTMPDYEFIDYNNDGIEELVTTVHMRGGAPAITEIIYFIYSFTKEGVKLKEILPNREYQKLTSG